MFSFKRLTCRKRSTDTLVSSVTLSLTSSSDSSSVMLGRLVESWTKKTKHKVQEKKNEQFPRLQRCAAFYLPPVSEVNNVHVGLLDVPLQVFWALLLLQVYDEGQLILLPTGLRRRLRHEHGAPAQPQRTDNKPPDIPGRSRYIYNSLEGC